MFFKAAGLITGTITGYHLDKIFKSIGLKNACALLGFYIGSMTVLQLRNPESQVSNFFGTTRETTGYFSAFFLVGYSFGIALNEMKRYLNLLDHYLNNQEEATNMKNKKL